MDKMKDGIFNVAGYGAKGCGGDDTEAIQSAVDDALNYGKGTVYFPAGVYCVSSPIRFSGDGSKTLTVKGSDENNTKIVGTKECAEIFSVQMEYNFNLYHLSFSSQGNCGTILTAETVNVNISRCNFDGTAEVKDPLVNMIGSNIKVSDCRFHSVNPEGYALRCYSVDGKLNINNYIVDNYFGSGGKGILVDSVTPHNRPEGLKINRNVFLNTGTEQITIETILHCDISNNMMDQCSGANLLIRPKKLGAVGLYVVDNYISPAIGWNSETWNEKGDRVCIQVLKDESATLYLLTAANNMMCYSDFGIKAEGGSSSVIISGNTFNSIIKEGIQMKDASSCVISGNQFTPNGKEFISLDLDSENGPYAITGNIMSGNCIMNIPEGQITAGQNFLNGSIFSIRQGEE